MLRKSMSKGFLLRLQAILLLAFTGWVQGLPVAAQSEHPATHEALLENYRAKCHPTVDVESGNLFPVRDDMACFREAKYAQYGLVGDRNLFNANVFYTILCHSSSNDPGHDMIAAAACAQIGGMYVRDEIHISDRYEREIQGEAVNLTLANEYYERACDAGLWVGCSNLANAYRWERGVEKDLQRAAELYEQGCENGKNALPCLRKLELDNLDRIDNGRMSQAQIRDQEIYSQTSLCLGSGDGHPCFSAASLMRYTLDADSRNMDLVISLYGAGCDVGHVDACYTLGVLYEEGRSIPADIPKAYSFYRRACQADQDGDHPFACPSFNAMLYD